MLRKRMASAAVLGTMLAAAFFIPGQVGAGIFMLLSAAMLLVGIQEFFRLTKPVSGGGYPVLTSVFGLLILLSMGTRAFFGMPAAVTGWHTAAPALVCFILCVFIHIFNHPDRLREGLDRLFTSLACIIWVCWSLSFIPALYFSSPLDQMAGRLLVVYLIIVTKSGDVGAYTVGSLTAKRPQGNHKMAPALSPKKSWEGFAGGMATCVLTALVLNGLFGRHLTLEGVRVVGFWGSVLVGVMAAVLGFIGDVAESTLKRAAKAKDSGWIPGLGGVLDVVDSLVFVAPLFYVWVRLVASLPH